MPSIPSESTRDSILVLISPTDPQVTVLSQPRGLAHLVEHAASTAVAVRLNRFWLKVGALRSWAQAIPAPQCG